MYYAWCYDVDPIQGQGHGAFELPEIAENCTFLGLSCPPFSRGAENGLLVVIAWHRVYSMSEPDFRISFEESYHGSSYFRGMLIFHEIQMAIFW